MKMIKALLLLFLASNLVLSQTQNDETDKNDSPVKTSNFKFEKSAPALLKRKVAIPSKVKVNTLPAFDTSFLKDYEFKKYNMGNYYFDSSLICMPFNEWGAHTIPYHLKVQTFSVMKKKKK